MEAILLYLYVIFDFVCSKNARPSSVAHFVECMYAWAMRVCERRAIPNEWGSVRFNFEHSIIIFL